LHSFAPDFLQLPYPEYAVLMPLEDVRLEDDLSLEEIMAAQRLHEIYRRQQLVRKLHAELGIDSTHEDTTSVKRNPIEIAAGHVH
jgi:hypothetical protein